MVVGALLGIEPLTKRKSIGVCVAVLGVIVALSSGLSAAPSGAWRGELIMTGAVLCMAFYNVWSRPFIQRSSALGFLTVGMGAGAAALIVVGSRTGASRFCAVLARHNGLRASISELAGAHSRLSCGSWRLSARRRRA
jgi:drug/metabolite transporter (DMT)-like permease